jgi:DNA-binding IclR family transcriptional regulator
MLAGMALDLFTPMKDGPLRAEQLASELGVDPGKMGPLLHALVVAGLLTEQDGAFSNRLETDAFVVRGRAEYLGDTHKNWHSNLQATLQTPETMRTGVA